MSTFKINNCLFTKVFLPLILFLTQLNAISIAQEIKISLKPMVDRNHIPLVVTKRTVDNTEGYKGLNLSQYVSWQLYLSSFSGNQTAYEQVGMKALKDLDPTVDTSMIYLGRLERNNIASFVGMDMQGKFHAVVDANNNRDFNDDKWYIFKPNLSAEKFAVNKEEISCKISYFDGKQLRDTNINMDVEFLRFPKGYNGQDDYNQNGRLKKLFELRILKKSYKIGKANVNGQEYSFLVSDPYYNLYPSSSSYSLTVNKSTLNNTEDLYQYHSNSDELVRVGNGLYRIPKVIRDELLLTYVKDADYDDGSLGNNIAAGTAEDLICEKKYVLGKGRGRYTLIDFWASWCKPCIAAIPSLKAIHTKFAAKGVDVLSLAIDKPYNKQKLKKLISENQMDWAQLYMDVGKEGRDYLNKNHIWSFPTTILLDPEGKVIYRGTTEASLRNAEQLLDRLIPER